MSTTPREGDHTDDAMPDLLLLFEAFVAGFAASGEGWNGEYPFRDKRQSIEDDPEVRAKFLRWARGGGGRG